MEHVALDVPVAEREVVARRGADRPVIIDPPVAPGRRLAVVLKIRAVLNEALRDKERQIRQWLPVEERIHIGEAAFRDGQLGGCAGGDPRNRRKGEVVVKVGELTRIIEIRIVEIDVDERLENEPLVVTVVAAGDEAVARAQAKKIRRGDAVDHVELRKVQRRQLRGGHYAVELEDLIRSQSGIVDVGVVGERLDDMHEPVESEQSRLGLLELRRELERGLKTGVHDRPESAVVVVVARQCNVTR